MDFQGRTVLVTGGAHRVGGALSLAFARAGADVVVHYHSAESAARATVAEIEALGRRAVAVPADLAAPEEVARVVDRAVAAFGGIDVLVNSASRFDRSPVAEITAEAWDRVQAVNLRAPFLLAQAATPALRERRGCIINLVDLSAFQAWPSYVHHAVSKAGLLHLTRCLARALAPDIRVNAIAPGTVLPPEDFDGGDNAGGADRRVLPQAGTPADVTHAALYLASAPFVTGEVIVVDGGRHLL